MHPRRVPEESAGGTVRGGEDARGKNPFLLRKRKEFSPWTPFRKGKLRYLRRPPLGGRCGRRARLCGKKPGASPAKQLSEEGEREGEPFFLLKEGFPLAVLLSPVTHTPISLQSSLAATLRGWSLRRTTRIVRAGTCSSRSITATSSAARMNSGGRKPMPRPASTIGST